MCGRFDNHLPKMHGWSQLITQWPEVARSYNIAPSTSIAAFAPFSKLTAPAQSQGVAMRWGMVPNWAKEFDSKFATFNARLETVAEKPSFRNAWRKQQRCLIPMRGYYEWQKNSDGKQPFFITDKNVGGLVTAGLFELWEHEEQHLYSCTMITRPADPGLDRIHGRMPVLLTPESAEHWLFEKHKALEFLTHTKTPEVVYWPVNKGVGNVRNNNESLSHAVDW